MNKKILLTAALTLTVGAAMAQNPFVQTWYTSDPAPMVHGDRLYVYTGHDEDGADFFWMQEWRVYSTEDMVNWQDHGSPLALESFSWADDRAWAAQTIERNGKFYWYVCAHSRLSKGMAIGVAVSDSPTGPFRDAIGKPLYENGSWDHIDPTVMIEDIPLSPSEGGGTRQQAWIMWGNPQVYYAKLNDDMISIDGEVKKLPMTEEAFGSPAMNQREKGKKYKDSYVEGPWLMKAPLLSTVGTSKASPRGGSERAYHLLYAAGGVPEHISYSTAPSPEGPWTYAGEIMPLSDTKSFTNHCGVADYKGHSYFFYHTGKLPGGGGFGRSVAVEEFKYNADGSFPTILPTDEGVNPIATFNPYRRVEAETMAFSKGVKTEQHATPGEGNGLQVYVTDIHNGDYIKLQNVAFGNKTPRTFTARVASGLRGGAIEVRLDSLGGELLGTLRVTGTGGWELWQTQTVDLRAIARGTHDLYFVFTGRKGPKLFNFDWWEFGGLEQVNMPLFQTKFTADPSPLVVGDTLFVYTSHDASPEEIPDLNEKNSAGFFMYDWLLWSTTDMVNWTCHGAVASLKDFAWRSRDNGGWAIQTVERNGKYYLYAPLHGHGIGVLVADSPYGPFKDPLGEPLVWQKEHWNDIDPTVFIDDDGQAYMYWGNPHTYWVKLNDDMISVKGEITQLPHIEHYQEGPWLYKRNNKYYLAYASTCCPEALGYAMSDSPEGPWSPKGYIMRPTPRDRGNHPGICDYKGHSYVFGQNYDLMHLDLWEHHERRSVSATEITYNADGTIQEVPYWLDQKPLQQLEWLNPYRRVEAETMAWGYGLKTAKMGIENTGVVNDMPMSTGRVNMYVYDINDDEYIRMRGVDFGQGAKSFSLQAAATGSCTVTLRIDAPDGAAIATIKVGKTGSLEKYRDFTAKTSGAAGVHDLYICFSQVNGEVRLDSWQFTPAKGQPAVLGKSLIVEDGGTGPVKVVMKEEPTLPAHTVFAPQDLKAVSPARPLPVLVWGNGACTNSPWEHFKFLNEIASHGYIVIATGYIPMKEEPYNGPMSTAAQQIESIDWVIAQNADPQSPYYQKIDTGHICASGMSCGGLQTLYNCADPRITTLMICNSGLFKRENAAQAVGGMPMPPKSKLTDIRVPIIYILGGKTDIAYENGMDDFHRIDHVPACAVNYPVGHGGTYRQPHGGEFTVPALAWLDWQLKGDRQAAKIFVGDDCGLLKRKDWTIEKNQLFMSIK